MTVILRLALLFYLHPDAPPGHVVHAWAAQGGRVPATVLLAVAYEESRYRRGVVSPKGFCGVLQLRARSRADCQRIDRDVEGSYREAAAHLERWLAFCDRVRRPGWRCALAGYGSGVKAARGGYPGGRGERYAARVMRRAGLR